MVKCESSDLALLFQGGRGCSAGLCELAPGHLSGRAASLCSVSALHAAKLCPPQFLQGHPRPCPFLLLSTPDAKAQLRRGRSRPRQGSPLPRQAAVGVRARTLLSVLDDVLKWSRLMLGLGEGLRGLQLHPAGGPFSANAPWLSWGAAGASALLPCRSVPRACARCRPVHTSRAARPSVPRSRPQDAACPPGSTGTRASPHSRP